MIYITQICTAPRTLAVVHPSEPVGLRDLKQAERQLGRPNVHRSASMLIYGDDNYKVIVSNFQFKVG